MSASPAAASSRSAASAPRPSARIDADGLIVAPGFIDGHTHMDAQVAWDPLGSCSCWHGVTSVVMGNCGFALAPCKPEDREWFARCLTAVEDIPTEAMMAGIDWTWETFPEYLANVERLPKAINYGMYIGHSALRMYAMGRRALRRRRPRTICARMARAGARRRCGPAPWASRPRAPPTHVTPDDTPVASRIADWRRSSAWSARMAELERRHLPGRPRHLRRRSAARASSTGCARSRSTSAGRSCSAPSRADRATARTPGHYQTRLSGRRGAAGGRVWGQATTRSINAIFSLKSYLPFDVLPAWQAVRALPLAEQKRRLADPEARRRWSPTRPR